MMEKLKTGSYPEKIQILTLIPDRWSQENASKQFDVSEYLIQTARELKKAGRIMTKPAPKKVKHFHKKLSIQSKVSMKMMNTLNRCLEKSTMRVSMEMCTNKSDWFCAIYQNCTVHSEAIIPT